MMSDDDRALWEFMAQSLEPLRKKKQRVPETEAHTDADARESRSRAKPAEPPPTGVARERPRSRHPTSSHEPKPATQRPAPSPPPLATFERKAVRRIATGKVEIDARLDLHGLRQSEAHHQLVGFLQRCAVAGLSVVMVITGKGGPPGTMARPLAETMGGERGVLRRNVPLWLEEPALRRIVIGYRAAGARHGGDGALYIQLRKPARSR